MAVIVVEKPAEAEPASSRRGPGLPHLVVARRAEYLPTVECGIPPGHVRGRRYEFGAACAPGRTPPRAVHDGAVLPRVLGGPVLNNGAVAQHAGRPHLQRPKDHFVQQRAQRLATHLLENESKENVVRTAVVPALTWMK